MLITHRKLSRLRFLLKQPFIGADQQWNEVTETPRRDLSDHYPVYGHFEFTASSRGVMNSILWD
ncbi:MAG: hypothetical protein F6K26_28200 [Moorea sp. SIO2I5]|nr:hypothetical protein [Moorena sp. SIO2I5]